MRRWTWARAVGDLISLVVLALVILLFRSDAFRHAIPPSAVHTVFWLTSAGAIWVCSAVGWAIVKAHRAGNSEGVKYLLVGLVFFGSLAVGNVDILVMSYALPLSPPPTVVQERVYVDVVLACGGIAFPLGVGLIAARLLQQRRGRARLGQRGSPP